MQINSAYPAMASSLAASHQAMQCGLWSISRIYPLPFFSSNSFRYIASALEKFVHLSSISGGKVKTTGEAGGLHRPYKGLIQQRLKTHERFANRK